METVAQFILDHAPHAHWIIFGALMLAGINIPISEDLMIILGAILSATVIPENISKIFLCIFFGCYFSDWVSYWLGRTLGRKLWNIRLFAKTVDQKRLDQIHSYYAKYGFWTLLLGRLIPFGVRNCLFLTAGMGRMHFGKFILSDGIACLFSNTTLFLLAYTLGKNYELLLSKLKIVNIALFSVFVLLIIAFFWYKRPKKSGVR